MSLTASVSNLRSRNKNHKYFLKTSAELKPVFILSPLATPAPGIVTTNNNSGNNDDQHCDVTTETAEHALTVWLM